MSADRYPEHLAGYLVSSSDSDIELTREAFIQCDSISFLEEHPRHWEWLDFHSDIELDGEQRPNINTLSAVTAIGSGARKFTYLLGCRRSGSRALLLGSNSKVVEAFLKTCGSSVGSGLLPVEIGVDKLVRNIVASGGPYRLSHVYCKAYGFGGTLKSASFWGEDLAAAQPIRQLINNLNFSSCGLRPLAEAVEILRIGSNGHVSFVAPSDVDTRSRRLQDVIEALAFVSNASLMRTRQLPYIFS
jgi:hypothetical protein